MRQRKLGFKNEELFIIARDIVSELETTGEYALHPGVGVKAAFKGDTEKKALHFDLDRTNAPSAHTREITSFYGGMPIQNAGSESLSLLPLALGTEGKTLLGREPILKRPEAAHAYATTKNTVSPVDYSSAGLSANLEVGSETDGTSSEGFLKLSARRLSEVFCRDARRYDAHFERY